MQAIELIVCLSASNQSSKTLGNVKHLLNTHPIQVLIKNHSPYNSYWSKLHKQISIQYRSTRTFMETSIFQIPRSSYISPLVIMGWHGWSPHEIDPIPSQTATNTHLCHRVGNAWNSHMEPQNIVSWRVTYSMPKESFSANSWGVVPPMKSWKINAKSKNEVK